MVDQAPDIVVVEDDDETRGFYHLLLTSEGYRVRLASNSDEARAALAARLPDLVLTDAWIPSEQPLAILRQLRANPTTARLPVLVCTGAVDDRITDITRTLDDCTALVLKPFQIDHLLDTIAGLLQA